MNNLHLQHSNCVGPISLLDDESENSSILHNYMESVQKALSNADTNVKFTSSTFANHDVISKHMSEESSEYVQQPPVIPRIYKKV